MQESQRAANYLMRRGRARQSVLGGATGDEMERVAVEDFGDLFPPGDEDAPLTVRPKPKTAPKPRAKAKAAPKGKAKPRAKAKKTEEQKADDLEIQRYAQETLAALTDPALRRLPTRVVGRDGVERNRYPTVIAWISKLIPNYFNTPEEYDQDVRIIQAAWETNKDAIGSRVTSAEERHLTKEALLKRKGLVPKSRTKPGTQLPPSVQEAHDKVMNKSKLSKSDAVLVVKQLNKEHPRKRGQV